MREGEAMLRDLSGVQMFFWNVLIIGIWHVAIFLACIKLPPATFDATKPRYAARDWEHNGRWYRDKLKIQMWKDKVPQHIGKDGFSKAHLTDVSIEYLDEFILETCRGEWMHLTNCICAVVVLLLNPLGVGLLFAFLILLGNVPFAVIQRYNRFRLQVLRKKRVRDLRAAAMDPDPATVSA